MKELLRDPLILLSVVLVGFVFFFLAFQAATKPKIADLLEKIATVSFLFMMTHPTVMPLVLLHPETMTAPEPSAIAYLTRVVPYSGVLLILKYRYSKIVQHTLMFFILDPALALLMILVLISFLWSETPDYSLRGALVLVGVTLFASHIAQRYSWQELCKFMRLSLALLCFISLFYSVAIPSIGAVGKGWKGILGHANPLSSLMGLNAGFWGLEAYINPKSRKLAIGIVLISVLIIQNTNSAGGKVQLVVLTGSLLWLLFLKQLNFKLALTGVIILLVLAISGTIIVVENTETILVDILGKDLTLNGRTPLWTRLMTAIAYRPFLGYGYHGFWHDWRAENNPAAIYATNTFGWVAHHAHNGFIDLALYVGLIGLLLFLISLIKNLVLGVLYLIRNESLESALPLGIMTILIVVNISLSQLMDVQTLWVYYVMISVRLSLDANKS
ncbi:MAG: O-antigen ligase family protein [Cyanobacteria bacterium P01_H01_bin.35]